MDGRTAHDIQHNTPNHRLYQYNGKRFEVPVLSAEGGIVSEPQACRPLRMLSATGESQDLSVLQYLGTVWDPSQFETGKHVPITLGPVHEDHRSPFFDGGGVPRVLDLPIKFPGSFEYRIPKALSPFLEVIQQVASYERFLTSQAVDFHAYLTLDYGYVSPGSAQRTVGVHGDGFQGANGTTP